MLARNVAESSTSTFLWPEPPVRRAWHCHGTFSSELVTLARWPVSGQHTLSVQHSCPPHTTWLMYLTSDSMATTGVQHKWTPTLHACAHDQHQLHALQGLMAGCASYTRMLPQNLCATRRAWLTLKPLQRADNEAVHLVPLDSTFTPASSMPPLPPSASAACSLHINKWLA